MSGWEPEKGPESWSDSDAWRGEVHSDGDDVWRGEKLGLWEQDEDETAESDSEDDWSGEIEDCDWPENLAGPEYWLFKRDGI